jgi:hypothetical protein
MADKLVLLGALFIGAVLLLYPWNGAQGEFDLFADCLTESGAVMYGADWCSHCQEQKHMFGSSFDEVNYVNCDLQPQNCSAADISGYPTWIIAGNRLVGTQSLDALSTATGCTI